MTGKAGELKTIKNGIPGTCLSSSTTVYVLDACQKNRSVFETDMEGKDVWKNDTAKKFNSKHAV